MRKIIIFKYLISFLILILSPAGFASTYASLCPVATEIIYALGAEKNLVGVSSACDYPLQVKQKPIIGDTNFVNMELLVKQKPDYLFALQSAKPKLGEISLTKTKPVYFEFSNIEQIYDAVNLIAKLTETEENAPKVIEKIKQNINEYKRENPKKILYVIQTNPLITIGKKSFITEIINKSGHISVTENLPYSYPNITQEYILKTNPEIIVVVFPSNTEILKKMFPNSKIIYLDKTQRDIINRPSVRVDEAVKFFSTL